MRTYLCSDNAPYPTIGATAPKREYLPVLTSLFAGTDGEFSLINELLYSELILPKEKETLAEIYDCMALVDIRHLRILGKLIVQCGGVPRFCTTKGEWWRAKQLPYPLTTEETIYQICQHKRTALKNYRSAIKALPDDGIQTLLSRICADELYQIDLLTACMKDF